MFSSKMGNASMSARNPTDAVSFPTRSTPTTPWQLAPVLPSPSEADACRGRPRPQVRLPRSRRTEACRDSRRCREWDSSPGVQGAILRLIRCGCSRPDRARSRRGESSKARAASSAKEIVVQAAETSFVEDFHGCGRHDRVQPAKTGPWTAWDGVGSVRLFGSTFEQNPTQYDVINLLSKLSIGEMRTSRLIVWEPMNALDRLPRRLR